MPSEIADGSRIGVFCGFRSLIVPEDGVHRGLGSLMGRGVEFFAIWDGIRVTQFGA
jgi:hypothetical protein